MAIRKSRPGASYCTLHSGGPSIMGSGGARIRHSQAGYPATFKTMPGFSGRMGVPNQASASNVRTDRFWYTKGSTGV
jgi:hypothetical protein